MANGSDEKKRHFILADLATTEPFSSKGGGSSKSPPDRDRAQHSADLRRQLEALREEASAARQAQLEGSLIEGIGLQVEFEGFPDVDLAFESLAREGQGIELLNARVDGNRTFATVFVPDGKMVHFEKMIDKYLAEKRKKNGHADDHKHLINTIRAIRAAGLQALWTEETEPLPSSLDGAVWWEVWLRLRGTRQAAEEAFRARAQLQEMRVAPGTVPFPERSVLLVRATVDQMKRSIVTLNMIVELRRPKETADFFDSLDSMDQGEWVDDLISRARFPGEGSKVPHVCLLDTGVNRGHPLIAPALDAPDRHSVEPGWGLDDEHGHGTGMAGLAIWGNLTDPLASGASIEVGHRLESVKLLPRPRATGNDPHHHAYLTIEAVARPEITDPSRIRVFGLSATARDRRDRGRPSTWSSAIDLLAADVDGMGQNPRLFILAAGNVDDLDAWSKWPDSNESDSIHDPAQAWNAITVGAFTELVLVDGDDVSDYAPIAPIGGLSPFSTTSLTWDSAWPLKPDVVFEGGNAAKDRISAATMPSLSLLTTSHRPTERLLTTSNATSAATALASRFAAQIREVYPDLWPETVRALTVHSAEWTSEMMDRFLPGGKSAAKKGDYEKLIRRCGFGVPDLDRALWTVKNSLTMVIEETLHPFKKVKSKSASLRDMHLFALPWPREALEALSERPVEMRVTLSYFIEPNPSTRGTSSRYRYASHGLRFKVSRPAESREDFRIRVNAAAEREEEEGSGKARGGDDSQWLVGTKARHRGSLHADIWTGLAADLARLDLIAVYPSIGWWRTREKLNRYDQPARYALIVSIRAPESEVDLYTEVANQVGIPIVTEV